MDQRSANLYSHLYLPPTSSLLVRQPTKVEEEDALSRVLSTSEVCDCEVCEVQNEA